MTTIEINKEPAARSKILVVDDDPLVLELLGISISSFGYLSVSAEDGLVAVEKLKRQHFDVVITDMMMPNMDGMQLLRHIKKKYPKTGVIVVTGYTGTFSYTDVIKAGASDFISKPFNTDELEAKVSRIIREQVLISRLERLSSCDHLTNLYNRRYFDIKLMEEVHRARRQQYPVFLGLLDLDRFKEYNDTHGHQAGDKVLQAAGKVLRWCTRDNVDWVFRYGGDEFAFIAPHISLEQAVQVGERIVGSFLDHKFDQTGISIGLAKFIRNPENTWEEDIVELINRADKAMYAAKAAGRKGPAEKVVVCHADKKGK